MKKQVDKSHYAFARYMDKARWTSLWHQLDEVAKLQPRNVLEIGPGAGVFANAARTFGLHVETLDFDPELRPDHLGSADAIPLADASFDVACAFQVLEHMPFDTSLKALAEMRRVARKAVIVSLPDVTTSWASTLTIPKFGTRRFVLPRPGYAPPEHRFDGEHYWEIGKRGYLADDVAAAMQAVIPDAPLRTYRVHENQYHRFFVFELPQ